MIVAEPPAGMTTIPSASPLRISLVNVRSADIETFVMSAGATSLPFDGAATMLSLILLSVSPGFGSVIGSYPASAARDPFSVVVIDDVMSVRASDV